MPIAHVVYVNIFNISQLRDRRGSIQRSITILRLTRTVGLIPMTRRTTPRNGTCCSADKRVSTKYTGVFFPVQQQMHSYQQLGWPEGADHVTQQSFHTDFADGRLEQQLVQGGAAEGTRRR